MTTRYRPQISRLASVRHGEIQWEDHAQRQKRTCVHNPITVLMGAETLRMSRGRGSVVIESKATEVELAPSMCSRSTVFCRSNQSVGQGIAEVMTERRYQSLTLDQQTIISIHTDLLSMTNFTPLSRHGKI